MATRFFPSRRGRVSRLTGPIVIAEMGALGQWQAADTPWAPRSSPPRPRKAIQFRRYLKALADQQAGAITFLWGRSRR